MASEFDRIVEACLDWLADGEGTVEECLMRFPQFDAELRPILAAANKVRALRAIQPAPEANYRVRGKLLVYMRTHPHRSAPHRRTLRPAWKLATSLAVLALAAITTTTAFAQYAMPGNFLYGWKRASENVWRAVSLDPLETDLALAQRRLYECMHSQLTGAQRDALLQSYSDTLNNIAVELQSMPENSQSVLTQLAGQQDLLEDNGLEIGELNTLLDYWSSQIAPNVEPAVENPTATATPTLFALDPGDPEELASTATPTDTSSNQGQGQGQGQGNQGNNGKGQGNQGNNGKGQGKQGGGNNGQGKGKGNQGGNNGKSNKP